MLRVLVFFVGIALLGYLVFAIQRNMDIGASYGRVFRGVQDYYSLHGRWPRTADEVVPIMGAPYAISAMRPTFRPLSQTEVEMETTDWSYLIPVRERIRIHPKPAHE